MPVKVKVKAIHREKSVEYSCLSQLPSMVAVDNRVFFGRIFEGMKSRRPTTRHEGRTVEEKLKTAIGTPMS